MIPWFVDSLRRTSLREAASNQKYALKGSKSGAASTCKPATDVLLRLHFIRESRSLNCGLSIFSSRGLTKISPPNRRLD
jgi:hypothetical protein